MPNEKSPRALSFAASGGAVFASTVDSKFGGSSMYFDGLPSSYIRSNVALPSAYVIGNKDWTLEMWTKCVGLQSNGTTWAATAFSCGQPSTSYNLNYIVVQYVGTDATHPTGIRVWGNNVGTAWLDITSDPSIPITLNEWIHIAVTRCSDVVTLWINGQYAGSSAVASGGISFGGSGDFINFGGLMHSTVNLANIMPFTGYIDDARFTYDVVRYPKNIAPLGELTLDDDPYANKVNLLLPFSGVSGSTTIVDKTGNFPVTVSGNAQLTSTQFRTGGVSFTTGTGSARLVDTGGMAQLLDIAGDFTWEAWGYLTSLPTASATATVNNFPIAGNLAGGGTGYFFGIYNRAGAYEIGLYNNSRDSSCSGGTVRITTNQWYHFAVSRVNTTTMIFLNGALVKILNGPSWDPGGSLQGTAIGSNGQANNGGVFAGYLEDIRFTKGKARYVGSFRPPEASFALDTDPNAANVSLQINGEDGLVDMTGKTMITAGTGTITTSNVKFGTKSIAFNGTVSTTPMMTAANPPGMDFGTGPFTIEMWARITSIPVNTGAGAYRGVLISNHNPTTLTTNNARKWELMLTGPAAGTVNGIAFYGHNDDGTVAFNFTGTIPLSVNQTTMPLNTWSHIAVVRNSRDVSIFMNGARILRGTLPANFDFKMPVGNTIQFGGVSFTGQSGNINGLLDDIRITKGVARYIERFTPPNVPMPTTNGLSAVVWDEVSNVLTAKPDTDFSHQFMARRVEGTGEFTYSLYEGSLPAGLTLSPEGVLSGRTVTTSSTISSTFTLKVQSGFTSSYKAFTFKNIVYSDPYAANVTVLHTMEGTPNQVATDLVNRATTGSASTITRVTPYDWTYTDTYGIAVGKTCLNFPAIGPGKGVFVTNPPESGIFTGPFTVEAWVRPVGAANVNRVICGSYIDQASSDYIFFINTSGGISIQRGATLTASANSLIPFNTWSHVAMSRTSDGTVRGFINGTQVISFVYAPTLGQTARPTWIGNYQLGYSSSLHTFQGQMSDFRITNGVARYSANFTPPDPFILP